MGIYRVSFNYKPTFSYCLGNIAGPLFFKRNEAPDYKSGMLGTFSISLYLATMVCTILAILFSIAHFIICHRENKRRDALGDIAQQDRAFEDLTDKEVRLIWLSHRICHSDTRFDPQFVMCHHGAEDIIDGLILSKATLMSFLD